MYFLAEAESDKFHRYKPNQIENCDEVYHFSPSHVRLLKHKAMR